MAAPRPPAPSPAVLRPRALALACALLGCGSPAPTAPADAGTVTLEGPDLAAATDALAPSTDAAVSPPDLAPPVAITWDPIPFGPTRQAEMAAYSLRHYGDGTSALTPKLIVLHHTDSATYGPVFNTFAADDPARGELPGTCAHFVVDKDGTIYQLVDLALRCRHAVGLNHVALGIELVQETLSSGHAADQAILSRSAQIGAALRLVKWLEAVYGLTDADVTGHAVANDSPLFLDLQGWVNDHDDWNAADVAEFRARLAGLP